MNTIIDRSFFVLFILFSGAICFSSGCGEDEPMGPTEILGCTNPNADNYSASANKDDGSCVISGCTDARAENYNSDANNEDGSCVFPNEKFIGNYMGSFMCPGLFSVINQDTIEFEITEPVDPDEKEQVTIVFAVLDIPISIDATVDGNDLIFDDLTIPNIPFEVGGIMVMADIVFSGNATIDGDTITASLDVAATIEGFPAPLIDMCMIVGVKQ